MHLRHVQIRFRDPDRIVFSPASACLLTRALCSLLHCLVYDWARVNMIWPGASLFLGHSEHARDHDQLQRIMDIFGDLQCAFEALATHASRLACSEEAQQLTEAAYPAPPLFEADSSNNVLFECDVVATAPHIENGEECAGTPRRSGEASPVAGKGLEDVSVAFCAVNEDMTTILSIFDGTAHGFMTNSNALMELWRIADHSERHCDMARQAICGLLGTPSKE